MSKLDVVKAWTDTNDLANIEKYLSDDFRNISPKGQPQMDKKSYLGFASLLYAALPDMKYFRADLYEEGDYVIMKGHFEGTFENDLDLSAMGFGVIPANGKRVIWPESGAKVEVEGGKITSLESIGQSGEQSAFLAPLGVEMPQS